MPLLQEGGRHLLIKESIALCSMRRTLGSLIFKVCDHQPELVAGRLQARQFLAAVRQCQEDPSKRGAMEGTLTYLDKALADIGRYCYACRCDHPTWE